MNKFIKNFVSVGFINAANAAPLITMPYLIHVIGIERFGSLSLATAFVAYFGIIIDYGFNLSAVREISINRSEPSRINHICATVFYVKIILVVACLLVFLCIVRALPYMWDMHTLYFLTFIAMLGQTFLPGWFFQGVEQMSAAVYLSAISRIIPSALTFFFVHSRDDYLWVPGLSAIAGAATVITAAILLRYKFDIRMTLPDARSIKQSFRGGWYLFLSQVNISLFSNSNSVILGVVSGPLAVGYFSSAEKIMRAIAFLGTPLTTVLFPHVARNIKANPSRMLKKLDGILLIAIALQIIVIAPIFFLADHIINLLYNSDVGASEILKIIIVVPIFIMVNNIYGVQVMLNTGFDKQYFGILLIAGVVNIPLCFLLSKFFSGLGTAISLLVIEFLIAFLMGFFVQKLKRSLD
ncbi:flippase [Paraburkholderia acidisoli]|uniref:Oligosaccharide flippase family protein n=1 Tax=Paraburkholderia acidisoli TaxID=2571748 RepID=A0A7Z2JD22_9BURK|nr:flippase [Paraburkholderia acidisoli]QGZ60697.1 oligosaccharide flippase family protein [Paraburkholderia acidisoli]